MKGRTGFRGFWGALAAVSWTVLGAVLPLQEARATEGVIQINQAQALAGGVTAGDAAGFPVTLSASGSYVLTGDLTLPDTATTAITVTADWVTIDLNGFEIAGPNSCTWNGSGVDCTATSTGDGIKASGRQGLTVRNGAIRGMGDDGIEAGAGTRVESVTADGNGGVGIQVSGGYVTRSAARLNGDDGIHGGGILAENGARNNNGEGIWCNSCTVWGSTAVENGSHGIGVNTNSLVHDNVSEGNYGKGIDVSAYSNAYNNMVSNNAQTGMGYGQVVILRSNTARQNGLEGIDTAMGSLVLDNTIEGNGRWGLNMSGGAYVGNNVLDSGLADVQGGTELGPNLCGGNTTCP